MPGKYGRVDFIFGEPSTPKQVRSGSCVACGVECYREIFVSGKGWIWRHYGCDPVKPVIVRQYARGHKPMSYVPKEYDDVVMGQKYPGGPMEPVHLKRFHERQIDSGDREA